MLPPSVMAFFALLRTSDVMCKCNGWLHYMHSNPIFADGLAVTIWYSQVPQPTLRSGLGLHCPYRRGIFLSTLPARPIWTAHGQGGAHWIGPHHTKPHAQAQLFFQSLILPFTLHFHPPAECNFCWRQLFQSDFSFSSFQISSCRMQLLFLLKVNASVLKSCSFHISFVQG